MEHDYEDDLAWHALNYRTAGIIHAAAMWRELEACIERIKAAERERCAKLCEGLAARRDADDPHAKTLRWAADSIRDPNTKPNSVETS